MEIKSVKALGSAEQKSKQQIEEELLKEKERKDAEAAAAAEAKNKEEGGIKDEDVLNFIKEKTGKEISSFDDLFKVEEKVVEKEVELPEDVKKLFDFKRETGRGLNDFMRLQRDFDSMQDDDVLREYYRETKEGLDSNDINTLINKFSVDEDHPDYDDRKIAKKTEIAKAKKFLNQQKEKYKAPLELSGPVIPEEDKNLFDKFKQYKESQEKDRESALKRSELFTKKTEELLNSEFKGFEFDIEGSKLVFNPGSPDEIKKAHSSPTNLIKKFLDENGMIKDAEGYHKSMAVALNPEGFAKFFFEQGRHLEKHGMLKSIKNIEMDSKRKHQGNPNEGGFKARAINQDSAPSGRLVIKKR